MGRNHKRSRFPSDECASSLRQTARDRSRNRKRRKYANRGSRRQKVRPKISLSIEANPHIQKVRSRISRVAIPPRSRIVEKYDLRNVINCRTSRMRNARNNTASSITARPNIKEVRSGAARVVTPPRSEIVERFDLRNVINLRTSRMRNARNITEPGITENPDIQHVRNRTTRVVIPPRKGILERFDLRNLINLRTNTRNTRDNTPTITANPDIQRVRKGSTRVVIPPRSQHLETLDLTNEINFLTSRMRNARNNTTPVITANPNIQQEPRTNTRVVITPRTRIVERYRLLNVHSTLASRTRNARNNTTPVITENPNIQQVSSRSTRLVIRPCSRIVERYKLRNVHSGLSSRPRNARNITRPVFSDNPSTQKLQKIIPSAVVRPFSQNLVWPEHGNCFSRVRSAKNGTPSAITQDSHIQRISMTSSYIAEDPQTEISEGYGFWNEPGFRGSRVRNTRNDTFSAIAQDSDTQELLNRFARINDLPMSEISKGYGYRNEGVLRVPRFRSSSNSSPMTNAQDTNAMQAPCTSTSNEYRLLGENEEGYEHWTEHAGRFYKFRNERDEISVLFEQDPYTQHKPSSSASTECSSLIESDEGYEYSI